MSEPVYTFTKSQLDEYEEIIRQRERLKIEIDHVQANVVKSRRVFAAGLTVLAISCLLVWLL